MTIDIRPDFSDAGPGLPRLVVLARVFAENDDQWSHLKNREDFGDIWHMPRPVTEAFDRLYAEGRDLAAAMARSLVAFNDPRRHPTLASYLDMMDKWTPHLSTLEEVGAAAARAESGVTVPWAARRMQMLFENQIGMFREALRVVERLRDSTLYAWEAGMASGSSAQVPYGPSPQPVMKAVAAPASQATQARTISILYTHDNPAHKAWVKALADRLSRDGFHVGLDQYDLAPGDEMSTYMEQLVTGAHFKIAVCSNAYVEKTNALSGGAGYEKTLLAGSLIKSQARSDIIPVIRNNSLEEPLPTFIATRLYLDFREDAEFELRYVELSRKLSGLPPSDRPLPTARLDVGAGGFGIATISHMPTSAAASSGALVFNYGNNNGGHIIEAGDDRFDTRWSSGSQAAIHAYNDGKNMASIALAEGALTFDQISDPDCYDWSSRARMARLNDIVLWRQANGAILATKIDRIEARTHGDAQDVLSISFAIVRGSTVSKV